MLVSTVLNSRINITLLPVVKLEAVSMKTKSRIGNSYPGSVLHLKTSKYHTNIVIIVTNIF